MDKIYPNTIHKKSEKVKEVKTEIEQTVKKSKGSRRKKDVNEALKAAENVGNMPIGKSKDLVQ